MYSGSYISAIKKGNRQKWNGESLYIAFIATSQRNGLLTQAP
jgi:hypothetical protein